MMTNEEKLVIKYPHRNGNDYCEKCIYNDKNYDDLCCVRHNYINCGAVIQCGSYIEERKEDVD